MTRKSVPVPIVENRIILVCGQKVLIECKLAALYTVEARTLNHHHRARQIHLTKKH
jgi:hypothetical protein